GGVLERESDCAVQSAQPGIADGHAVSVSAQVIQDVVGSDHRTFGKDDPTLSLELAQQLCESAGLAKSLEVALELELAGGVKLEQSGTELGSEDLAHGAHWNKPAGLFGAGPGVLSGQPTTADMAVEVRMVHEILAPGMKDGGDGQLGAEALLAKLEQCGTGALE